MTLKNHLSLMYLNFLMNQNYHLNPKNHYFLNFQMYLLNLSCLKNR
jgi:hypothetical protein